MERRLIAKSKRLSWLLRHGVRETGIVMDRAGWVSASAVLAYLQLSRVALEEVVEQNSKRRLQLEGDRLRACQGHSLSMPVTREALEDSWMIWTGEGPIWHGTGLRPLPLILEEGLKSQRRTHVHLAEDLKSKVGKRASVAVMLRIDPRAVRASGLEIFRAPNGVILVQSVPPEAITGGKPCTRRAQRDWEKIPALQSFARLR